MPEMLRRRPLRAVLPTLAASAFLLGAAPAAQADALSQEQEEAVRALIEETLRERPELIVEALQEMQRRDQAASEQRQRENLARLSAEIEASPVLPVMGNPEGSVTLVEFFDYQCPYCRAVIPALEAAIDANDDLRVVLVEMPILGEVSQTAARAAIASTRQGDQAYLDFHHALMGFQGRLANDDIFTVAREAGLDEAQLRQDMEAGFVNEELQRTRALARALDVRGTPFFVIGGRTVPGALDAQRLQNLIEAARETG